MANNIFADMYLVLNRGVESEYLRVWVLAGSRSLPFEGDFDSELDCTLSLVVQYVVLAGVRFLPILLSQVCPVIMPICFLAPFIRRI